MEFEHAPNDPTRKELSPLLKLALELGPLGVFFLFNARGEQIAEAFPVLQSIGQPIFLATAAFMVAITISLTVSLWLTRRLPIMPLVSGVVVLVFGALTLWLHDELFIKLKPTIVNCLFGSILLGGLLFGKSLLGYVFDSAFKLTDEGWRKLTLRWGLFFFVLAVINEIVWRSFSTDFWVNFKVFGVMPITLLFTLTQLPLIQKYAVTDESKDA
ncbi:MAG: septation protein A [Roseibium album]|uniref:Inner membrane-spanning protein YciB n=1 Tax=Roseibium album TaxID=311410 RepID=A0A0M7AB55_9HYPH|nr:MULTISPECIES: septation protein A [Stappiaceae]MBG6157605.1 intracellular septation protein [Labrenzia sp. EL_162]MBG6163038.1 intracellular septation protein [Labrenzia sp. EL_195]MBG6196002.1 intracellular septation protein [Labrenzia sp. EL_159]MBG6201424.1 intracellular septation protein [Labrenzia sp. EL_13]MBG6208914.1 intracellular septation protein [Labrenzia sp. EL_126]MCR9058563.1 septation protein A [Paracoccaceae bacterium]